MCDRLCYKKRRAFEDERCCYLGRSRWRQWVHRWTSCRYKTVEVKEFEVTINTSRGDTSFPEYEHLNKESLEN